MGENLQLDHSWALLAQPGCGVLLTFVLQKMEIEIDYSFFLGKGKEFFIPSVPVHHFPLQDSLDPGPWRAPRLLQDMKRQSR